MDQQDVSMAYKYLVWETNEQNKVFNIKQNDIQIDDFLVNKTKYQCYQTSRSHKIWPISKGLFISFQI
jgi:hypothetical protein